MHRFFFNPMWPAVAAIALVGVFALSLKLGDLRTELNSCVDRLDRHDELLWALSDCALKKNCTEWSRKSPYP